MNELTLQTLEQAFKATKRAKATPHRTPDFKKLRKLVEPDALVSGRMVFIEEHNTGYGGVLYRWQFFMTDKDGNRVSVWADLLPDIVTSARAGEQKMGGRLKVV